MKNKKLLKLTLILFFYFVPSFNLVTSEEIKINSSELNILEGGKILSGKNGFDAISGENFKISGNEFLYDKNRCVQSEILIKIKIKIIRIFTD